MEESARTTQLEQLRRACLSVDRFYGAPASTSAFSNDDRAGFMFFVVPGLKAFMYLDFTDDTITLDFTYRDMDLPLTSVDPVMTRRPLADLLFWRTIPILDELIQREPEPRKRGRLIESGRQLIEFILWVHIPEGLPGVMFPAPVQIVELAQQFTITYFANDPEVNTDQWMQDIFLLERLASIAGEGGFQSDADTAQPAPSNTQQLPELPPRPAAREPRPVVGPPAKETLELQAIVAGEELGRDWGSGDGEQLRKASRQAAAKLVPVDRRRILWLSITGIAIGWVLVSLLFRSGLPAETDMSTIVISVLILAVVVGLIVWAFISSAKRDGAPVRKQRETLAEVIHNQAVAAIERRNITGASS